MEHGFGDLSRKIKCINALNVIGRSDSLSCDRRKAACAIDRDRRGTVVMDTRSLAPADAIDVRGAVTPWWLSGRAVGSSRGTVEPTIAQLADHGKGQKIIIRSIAVWSIAAVLYGMAQNLWQLALALRFVLREPRSISRLAVAPEEVLARMWRLLAEPACRNIIYALVLDDHVAGVPAGRDLHVARGEISER